MLYIYRTHKDIISKWITLFIITKTCVCYNSNIAKPSYISIDDLRSCRINH